MKYIQVLYTLAIRPVYMTDYTKVQSENVDFIDQINICEQSKSSRLSKDKYPEPSGSKWISEVCQGQFHHLRHPHTPPQHPNDDGKMESLT